MMKQTRVISFYTDKGGTGKTTMNVTLCSYLAYKLGLNVILFDTDHPSLHAFELRKRELEAVEKDEELRNYIQQSFSGDIRPYEIFPVKDEFDKFTRQDATFVFVTNEIGLSGVSDNKIQRQFTDLLGWLNQYIASKADEVYFMVSGIPIKIK